MLFGTRIVAKSNPKNSARIKMYERLVKGEEICTYMEPNIRKEVAVFKRNGFPVETIQCDKSKCKNDRKHIAYYYEWAVDYREMSQVIDKINNMIGGK